MPKPMISGPYRTFRRLNPDQTFLEFEGSTITIPMRGRRAADEPWMEDNIQLQAFMRLEIYRPYTSNLGTREFQFTIRDWNLYGKSPMLNQLFFNDPRGRPVESSPLGTVDYVPAVVTFNVNNHYHVAVDAKFAPLPFSIFASEKLIEFNNLTSHDLRIWTRYPERGRDDWLYSQPNNKVYWQLVPGAAVAKTPLTVLLPEKERDKAASYLFVVFHKKPLFPPDKERGEFDVANASDLANYLLAAAVIDQVKGSAPYTWISARNPFPGHRGNRVQVDGNTVTSFLYRPRDGVNIRFALTPEAKDLKRLLGLVQDAAKKAGTKGISGSIEIASPARSLGAADNGPDVGEPVNSADFPARITYAINYNIFVNNRQFIEDQAGIAIADGCLEVPPRDVTVAFEKIHIGQVAERFLEFDNGHCTGMHEISADDYDAGTNFCRYWRTVPLTDTDDWGAFRDYDPTREY